VIHDSLWLRKLAYWGARYGTTSFVTNSPKVIGIAFAALLVNQRRVVLDNLRRILGRRSFFTEQRDVAATFSQYAACLAEALGFERMQQDDIRYHVSGGSHLSTLVENRSGFIVLTAHSGAWDLAARHLQEQLRRPVMIAMSREPNAAARSFQDTIRLRRGIEIAHVGEDAFEGLALLRHLRGGGVVAVQVDRMPPGSRAITSELFGKSFLFPAGPFQLARLARVPVVSVFCARLGYFEYEVNVNRPISIGTRPGDVEVEAAVRSVSEELEEFLKRYPTQWFNFERSGAAQATLI
jgi:KDO2-lipid IV(A) lauroyltransferase